MRPGITAVLFFAAAVALAGESPRTSYVYSRGSRPHIISASRLDVVSIRKLQRRYGNDFLWARVDGRAYVIRDTAALDEVRRLYAPLDAFTPPAGRIGNNWGQVWKINLMQLRHSAPSS